MNPVVATLIFHRVFASANRVTDNRDEFRRRWYRTAEATNFIEPLDSVKFHPYNSPP